MRRKAHTLSGYGASSSSVVSESDFDALKNTSLAVISEWFRDWAGPLADAARETFVWYLGQVPQITDRVGITEGEAALAQAAMAG